jgi:hypothetical protein
MTGMIAAPYNLVNDPSHGHRIFHVVVVTTLPA